MPNEEKGEYLKTRTNWRMRISKVFYSMSVVSTC
jgi:hypothetical protein